MNLEKILNLDTNTILLTGEITEELANKILLALDILSNKWFEINVTGKPEKSRLISLIINSASSYTEAIPRLTEALWALNKSDCYLTALALKAYDGAFVVLQSCQMRTALKNSRDILSFNKVSNQQDFFTDIAWRSEKTLKEIYSCSGIRYSAEEAKKHNFLDFIWDTPPPFLRGFLFSLTRSGLILMIPI